MESDGGDSDNPQTRSKIPDQDLTGLVSPAGFGSSQRQLPGAAAEVQQPLTLHHIKV
jgi:hypothetical protein